MAADNDILQLILSELKDARTEIKHVDGRIDNVNIVLAKNTSSLEEHIRRTNLLEEHVQVQVAKIHADMEPIKDHVATVKGVAKFLGLASLVSGLILAFFQIAKTVTTNLVR